MYIVYIYIKYLPFHKTLPRSGAFINFISVKVWWNGLYNRDQCVMFTYWCIRGDWDKLQLSWAELELNNVYTSLSWTMYIHICIRPWAEKCTYIRPWAEQCTYIRPWAVLCVQLYKMLSYLVYFLLMYTYSGSSKVWA